MKEGVGCAGGLDWAARAAPSAGFPARLCPSPAKTVAGPATFRVAVPMPGLAPFGATRRGAGSGPLNRRHTLSFQAYGLLRERMSIKIINRTDRIIN